jgi:hypothetical protein
MLQNPQYPLVSGHSHIKQIASDVLPTCSLEADQACSRKRISSARSSSLTIEPLSGNVEQDIFSLHAHQHWPVKNSGLDGPENRSSEMFTPRADNKDDTSKSGSTEGSANIGSGAARHGGRSSFFFSLLVARLPNPSDVYHVDCQIGPASQRAERLARLQRSRSSGRGRPKIHRIKVAIECQPPRALDIVGTS